MKFTVDIDPQLKGLIKQLGKSEAMVREDVWRHTVQVSNEMEQRVKSEMPVDTGRAKASWGRFSLGGIRSAKRISKAFKTKSGKLSKRAKFSMVGESGHAQVASPADAIWIEDKKNLTITQGTHLGYVVYLNEGHSMQAPQFFIDAALQDANIKMYRYGNVLGRMLARHLMSR